MKVISAFHRYLGIMGALLRREEESRRQAPMDTIMNLIEPVFLIGMLTFIFYFLGRRQGSPLGGSPILFYATGFFPLYLFIYISRRMRGAISNPNRRFPVEQRLDHILVHVILRVIDYSILGLLLFGGLYIFITWDAVPYDLVNVFQACMAIVALGFGWGIVNLVLMQKWHLWSFISAGISRGLIVLSGVVFVPDFLSPDAREVMAYNPLLHAIQLFKIGFYPRYPAILLDRHYLFYCAVFAVFFGLILERVTRRSESR
jgi:capsular polysaccharide transport system permease protein